MPTPKYKTDIPVECEEKYISAYREEKRCTKNGCGAAIWLEKREYWLNGALRGIRQFEKDGTLAEEFPYLHGKIHGTHYRWTEEGFLAYTREMCKGEIHGKTQQWAKDGSLIGSTKFVHGTGLDLWWHPYVVLKKEGYYLAECIPYQNGLLHGFERWLQEDQSLWLERHYWEGDQHGIERFWEDNGNLVKGYPKFYIANKEVDRASYVRASKEDGHLLEFRESDQLPFRQNVLKC